jgi:hypothetical protein
VVISFREREKSRLGFRGSAGEAWQLAVMVAHEVGTPPGLFTFAERGQTPDPGVSLSPLGQVAEDFALRWRSVGRMRCGRTCLFPHHVTETRGRPTHGLARNTRTVCRSAIGGTGTLGLACCQQHVLRDCRCCELLRRFGSILEKRSLDVGRAPEEVSAACDSADRCDEQNRFDERREERTTAKLYGAMIRIVVMHCETTECAACGDPISALSHGHRLLIC